MGWVFSSCKNTEGNQTIAPTDTTKNPVDTVIPPFFIRGADLSFLPEMRAAGSLFYDSAGEAKDALAIFKENGCNTVRLRLWHKPAANHSNLAEILAFSNEIKALGMKILLDIHYSDTWTDPGAQTKPDAWKLAGDSALTDSVYQYTKRVMHQVKPDFVQVGNELNGGFLWESGRISGASPRFITLIKSGIRAVREVNPGTQIILHFAGIGGSTWFFDLLKTNAVDYDMAGLSYYPVFHGKDLTLLATTMAQLAATHQKKILLAELSYPFTLQWADYTHNLVGLESQLVAGYPATPEGQLQYLLRLKEMVKATPGGAGFCYWAPDFIAFRGPTATNGSSMENQALFDFEHKALPGLKVFKN